MRDDPSGVNNDADHRTVALDTVAPAESYDGSGSGDGVGSAGIAVGAGGLSAPGVRRLGRDVPDTGASVRVGGLVGAVVAFGTQKPARLSKCEPRTHDTGVGVGCAQSPVHPRATGARLTRGVT